MKKTNKLTIHSRLTECFVVFLYRIALVTNLTVFFSLSLSLLSLMPVYSYSTISRSHHNVCALFFSLRCACIFRFFAHSWIIGARGIAITKTSFKKKYYCKLIDKMCVRNLIADYFCYFSTVSNWNESHSTSMSIKQQYPNKHPTNIS